MIPYTDFRFGNPIWRELWRRQRTIEIPLKIMAGLIILFSYRDVMNFQTKWSLSILKQLPQAYPQKPPAGFPH